MNQQIKKVNPIKAWLAEFFLSRCLIKPTGQPLYTYQVTESEYADLRQLLMNNLKQYMAHPVHKDYFAACFCLFVSEQYRRNYNGNWSWNGAEEELGIIGITPAQHGKLASQGLLYWQRPVRQRETGRDWLGSLFAEGGIPWPLVQSETHGFGRAIRRGIKNYYRKAGNYRTTADIMADTVDYLPQSFRNLDTLQLLAGIVDQLMYLAEQFALDEQKDPAAYLDTVLPHWQDIFPLPIDEANARSLINEWLRDAGEKKRERIKTLEYARAFTSVHRLSGELPDWKIQTEIQLPSVYTFVFDRSLLSSTRFDVAYYEGEKLLDRGPAVYGELTDAGIKIRFITTQVALSRRYIDSPISMHLLDNGHTIHQVYFDGSAIELDEYPLTFDQQDGHWLMASTSSCVVPSGLVRVRLPEGSEIAEGKESAHSLCTDQQQGQWFEITSDMLVRSKNAQWQIRLGQSEDQREQFLLVGTSCPYVCNPSVTYIGWPRLYGMEGAIDLPADWQAFANGLPLQNSHRPDVAGVVRYQVTDASGNTVLQRRFGVLPKDFMISMFPATANQPARLTLHGTGSYQAHVVSSELTVTQSTDEPGSIFHLQPLGEKPPAGFIMELVTPGYSPVQLRLPFPYDGVRLIAPDGQPCTKKDLILRELIGYRLVLSSGFEHKRDFHLDMDLVCKSTPRPQRHFSVKVCGSTVELDLYGYRNAIIEMLSSVKEQDAFVKFTISSGMSQLSLNIRRYNADLIPNRDDDHSLVLVGNEVEHDGCKPLAMLLPDPKQQPLELEERTTQGVGTGIFDLPSAMNKSGPWLVYPSKESTVRFRPVLHINGVNEIPDDGEINSLHSAAKVFHPKSNPDVINEQIRHMANDFNHSGWQYLSDLKQRFEHLPLSTFESWVALSRNDEALALAVFRLEMDIDFCARIRDELAIIWEAVPMPVWVSAFKKFVNALSATGLPEAYIKNLEKNRDSVLRFVVPGFDYLDGYLQTGDRGKLKALPIEEILPQWVMTLRTSHDSDQGWPVQLSDELHLWISKRPQPDVIKNMAEIGYMRAVIYMPVFMAHVTAGKAKLSELSVPAAYRNNAIRMISEFDRQQWYLPVHALLVSYLIANDKEN